MEWLRWRIPFAGDIALRNRAFFNRPDRVAGRAIKRIQDSLLRGLRNGFDGSSINRDVDENRSAWNIEIPDAVMDELKVPPALACLQI